MRNRSPRDTLNYPIKLNNQLAFVMEVVESGDIPPLTVLKKFLEQRSGRQAGHRAAAVAE